MPNKVREDLKNQQNPRTPTAAESYAQSMQLQQMQDAEKRRLAEQTASQEKQRLNQQLAEQRRNYMRGQGQMARQSESVNSQLLRQLSGRGMATGGLLQLGDIQGRMATGQGMSDMAYQDRMATTGLSQQLGQVAQNYQGAMNQADIENLFAKAQLGKELRGEERQDSTMMLEMLSSAISMLPEEQRTPELMNQFASLLANFGTSVGQGALGEELQGQVGSITDQFGQGGLPQGQTGKVTGVSLWALANRNHILEEPVNFGSPNQQNYFTSTELENLNLKNNKINYKVAGEKLSLTPLQMAKYIEDKYSSTLKDDVEVVVGLLGHIEYRATDGTTYSRLSEARTKQDALNKVNK